MQRRFNTLDVFTARRFAGNPLAVVHDAEGLDDAAMQAIAREFNLSETVFVLPPVDSAHRARVRIFTPAAELPFAGHPTVGTAVLLARIDGGTQRRNLVLEEGVGPVLCTVEPDATAGGRAQFGLPRTPEHLGDLGDAAHVAAALGLELDDLGCDDFAPGRWTAGNPFSVVPLRGLDAVARARANPTHWDAAFGAGGRRGAFLFCRDAVEPGHQFHARMFAPSFGIGEDPATGSAVAAFAGVLARYGGLKDGDHLVTIEQGYEMGRPSIIDLSVTLFGGVITTASIGGNAIVVSEGRIET